jgi:hypothetical protein
MKARSSRFWAWLVFGIVFYIWFRTRSERWLK